MAKWKVNEWVKISGSNYKLHIVEVLEQTCYAGVQVHYTGRVFYTEPYAKSFFPAKDLQKFLEIELEDIKPLVIPDKIKEAIKKWKEARRKKEDLVAVQDFEKAADIRADERKYKDEVEMMCEAEGLDFREVMKTIE